MIEDAMLFALGFCTATLVALLCLPAVWWRANRLVRRRLEMLVPLSMAELDAERDGLRARAAVAQRQLEQKLERATAAAAQSAIDLGHKTRELVDAQRARDDAAGERDTLAAALKTAEATIVDLKRSIEEAARSAADAEQRIQAGAEERRALHLKCESLAAGSDQRDITIAVLETSAEKRRHEIAELQLLVDKSRSELTELRATLAERTIERDAARKDALASSTARADLQKQVLDEARRAESNNARWLAKSEVLASVERKMLDQSAELNASNAALANLKQRFEALEARLNAAATANGSTPDLSDSDLSEFRDAISEIADDALRILRRPVRADALEPAAPPGSDPKPPADGPAGLADKNSVARNTGALF